MSFKQNVIRAELVKAENLCNAYYRMFMRQGGHIGLKAFHHFMGRRRFFLKDLLKYQLKEFDRG